jgi:hypothetical protein
MEEEVDAFREQIIQQVARRAERGDEPAAVGLWLIEQLAIARRELVAATSRTEETPNAHTLTLEFGRFLTETEFRDVVERAWQVPHVKTLRANAVATK